MRRIVFTVLAVAACCGLVFANGSAVQAHDELLNTTPANGELLAERPVAVTLTFAAPPLAGTTKLIATLDTGARINLDKMVVEGPRVTAAWPKELPGATYVIAWRSVGSDGHALTGTFSFTYATPGEGPTPGPKSGSPDVSILPVTPTPSTTSSTASSTSWLWPVLAGVLIIIAAVIVVVVVRSRRSDSGTD